MNLRKYKHTKWTDKPNRYTMELNEMTLDQVDEFNEIYQYCKAHYRRVVATESGSMPFNKFTKHYFRYMVLQSSTRFELVLVCREGCYRWTCGNSSTLSEKNNVITGKDAVKKIYAIARELQIDLSPYASSVAEGKAIKEEIDPPLIEEYCLKGVLPYKKIEDGKVHHLDLVSSYASRIAEAYPELKPLFKYAFDKRHEADNLYKHVLTNSIGCFQSVFCPKYKNARACSPFQFAKLSKVAINGTRKLVEEYVKKLKDSGRDILLTNTDGIWYHGELYHDEREGEELGQWKHDHKNCNFLVKSKGAYQYIEDGICYSVVRGRTNLDNIIDRTEWKFGQILEKKVFIKKYSRNDDVGVVETYGEI